MYVYMYVSVHMCVYSCTYYNVCIKQCFLIGSYGVPLTQRASYLTQHLGPDGAVNYDYIVTYIHV